MNPAAPSDPLDELELLLDTVTPEPWEVETYCSKHDGFHLRNDEIGGFAVYESGHFSEARLAAIAPPVMRAAIALARAAREADDQIAPVPDRVGFFYCAACGAEGGDPSREGADIKHESECALIVLMDALERFEAACAEVNGDTI